MSKYLRPPTWAAGVCICLYLLPYGALRDQVLDVLLLISAAANIYDGVYLPSQGKDKP